MRYKTIDVKIVGIKPIIFNQYVSKEDQNIPTEKKILISDGKVSITSDRLMAFLTDNNPKTRAGCIKTFLASKEYKKVLPKVDARVSIHPTIIPISKNAKYDTLEDKVCGGGVPNLVKRPALKDWEAEFQITLYETPEIPEDKLHDWFIGGGIDVGLGAHRPRYGQFRVDKWEVSAWKE